jgi:hypothetical protein
MEVAFFSIIVWHQNQLSLFSFFSTPQSAIHFVTFPFCHNFVFILFINLSIIVKWFVIETLRHIFCRKPSMRFRVWVSFHFRRIYLLMDPIKFIFEQLWTLLLSLNYSIILNSKIWMLFQSFFKHLVEKSSITEFWKIIFLS